VIVLRLIALCNLIIALAGCGEETATTANSAGQSADEQSMAEPLNTFAGPTFVGSQQCIDCHQEESTLWRGSHHDLAMQPANGETVLGNFNNASFDYFGTVSAFYQQDDQYFVKTDGPDGALTDYPIAYTFGAYPLQQYLIELPQGKLQALSIAWDSREQSSGGQRWFHLYPGEHIKHNDELHWTGINQNWNYMCADCHSTNLQKNYSHAEKTYATTWSEIDVACEACHGPASAHTTWAEQANAALADKGFAFRFNERDDLIWQVDSSTGNATRSRPKHTNLEIETCAACHSRRGTAHPGVLPGEPLLNNFNVSLLSEALYYPDGQINDEVYVYGSFAQSRMYHAGVTCSDCHNPHSLELRAEGNNLCAQCHSPAKYDGQGHHLHASGSTGAACVNCHMPEKTYMVVDPRRDHSFRVPVVTTAFVFRDRIYPLLWVCPTLARNVIPTKMRSGRQLC
jgi:hypothetical protein